MDIANIDKNFAALPVDENGFRFCDVKNHPLQLEGLPWFEENGKTFYRLPKTMTVQEINEGALYLANHTSGVCVRFRTDSDVIMLKAKAAYSSIFNHMPQTGCNGFDSFCRKQGGKYIYNKTVIPCLLKTFEQPEAPTQAENNIVISGIAGENSSGEILEWIINFPLYGGVESVEIGFKADAKVLPPLPHKIKAPVLFYGSSITQGGCASRPGNMYPSILCRELDAEQINLGFSGCGRAEEAVAKAIAGLKLSAFVMDYDHNAPDPEYLEKTHEKFFSIIREIQPALPVIFISKPDFHYIHHTLTAIDARRRSIIRRTYMNAVQKGDRNVYFIDGETLFGNEHSDLCTVDGCHPNDLGFFRMSRHILPTLQEIMTE